MRSILQLLDLPIHASEVAGGVGLDIAHEDLETRRTRVDHMVHRRHARSVGERAPGMVAYADQTVVRSGSKLLIFVGSVPSISNCAVIRIWE
jgi:hypothetical protein